MHYYQKRAGSRKHHPDLFTDWLAGEQLRAENPAARRIADRFRCSIHHALVVVEVGGFGGQSR